jgi:hypothetical protein
MGEIDPVGTRKGGLDAFLDEKLAEGFTVERRTDTHAIIFRRPKGLRRFDQLWAEYLTVIATSLLIPLELYELVHHPAALKAGGLVANLAIVAYLVHVLRRRKRGSPLAT